ncbi:hypothetical protein H9P43_001232 [Blastocladiella emersonii ATCC 22665]|nr:hypothetical protein H9P43_001232 [Blastocladiella emersonii ATCC 22665]
MPVPASLTGAATTLTFGATGVFVVLSYIIVRSFADPREREPLISVTTVFGMTLALVVAACTLPVDVLLVSASSDLSLGVKKPWADPATLAGMADNMGWLYDASFFVLFLFCFLAVPFAYFFFEEYDEQQSLSKRLSAATRMTLATAIILTVLLMCGLLMKPSQIPAGTPIDFDFVKRALLGGGLETALLFVLGVSMMIGTCVFLVYTATGLFLFPIHMLKPMQSFDHEMRTLSRELSEVQSALENMLIEFPDAAAMTMRDQRKLERLRESERFIQRKLERVRAGQPRFCSPVCNFVAIPVKVACLALSVCILIAIISTIMTTPPACPNCPRLVLPISSPANPVDGLLALLARAYPLDHILFALIMVYLLACTFHAVRALGVRVLWVKMFTLRPGRTMPQGLLLASVFMVLTLLSLMWEMTGVIAPHYATWGSQRYCPSANPADCAANRSLVKFCDLRAPTALCTPTVISLLLARIALTIPVFSTVFYYVQYAAVAVALLALAYAVVSARRSRAADLQEDDSDSDEEEAAGERSRLLWGGSRRE